MRERARERVRDWAVSLGRQLAAAQLPSALARGDVLLEAFDEHLMEGQWKVSGRPVEKDSGKARGRPVGGQWEASGRSVEGQRRRTVERPVEGQWEASGRPVGGQWEASGRPVRGQWEASGRFQVLEEYAARDREDD